MKKIQQEFFELCLNTEERSISSRDLIAYLTNANKLIYSINQTLNVKYAVGYDLVEVDVIALEAGSFKIPFNIKKITCNPTFASIAGSVMGILISNLFVNNNESQIIQYGDDQVVVTTEELLNNKKTANAIGSIAKMVVESEEIKDITVTYEKVNGEPEKVSISKRSLAKIMYDEPEDESLSNMISNITLEIVSPVFVDKPASWKVMYDNKTFTAKMTDEDFLETMNLQKISFAKGDVIVADMEIVAKTTERGIRLSHYIRKVHRYPKYSRVIKNELSLFDNVEN